MKDRIQDATSGLQDVATLAEERFAALSTEQLNWKPSATAWSVAQCLDHLIQSQRLYIGLFEKLADGPVGRSLWERISPFSGFFGRMLIRTVDPENRKPVKTMKKAEPSSSEFDGRIVESFVAHQHELIQSVEALPPDIDTSQIVTSPLLGLVTYRLDDAFTILVLHGRRHLDQAQRVTEAAGFPTP